VSNSLVVDELLVVVGELLANSVVEDSDVAEQIVGA